MGNTARSTERAVAVRERQDKALALRLTGKSYREVGRAMGMGKSRAQELVVRALAAIPLENAKAVLALELQRLDRMLEGLQRKGGAFSGNPRAVDSVLRIQERRAKYLGLDAPTRTEHTGRDGEPIEIELRPVIMIPAERVAPATERLNGSTAGAHLNGSGEAAAPSGLETPPGTPN